MKSIAILEDDPRICSFLESGLGSESYQTESFACIDSLLEILPVSSFDILIMDRMIGKQDALGKLKSIRLSAPKMRILILSALTGSINRIQGLEIGADDYLEKPFQFQELSIRLKHLIGKEIQHPESIVHYKDMTLELDGQRLQRAGRDIYLSPYEFKIMTIFMRNPDKIQSRTLLLDRVWGYNNGTSSNVVDVAIAKLRKKINFTGCTPLICSRRGSGYVLSSGASYAD